MKQVFSYPPVVFVLLMATSSCQDQEPLSDLTGNEMVYALTAGSVYDIHGTAIFQEKTDGTTRVLIQLEGTEGDGLHPLHLHYGHLGTPDAELAAMLNPVSGNTGKSETHLKFLMDETPITYQQLLAFEGCIKVHLGETGPDRDIILAAGNIGSAVDHPGGRISSGTCRSN
jgi:hypothetical protein